MSVSSGDVPLVVIGDDVPHRLLYLRSIWRLRLSPMQLKRAIENGPEVSRDATPRERLWVQAWHQAWECNDLVSAPRVTMTATVPDQQPAEWFSETGPEGFEVEEYVHWQLESSLRKDRLSGRGDRLSRLAAAAVTRGLKRIYVVPVEGIWAARREHILALSSSAFASDVTLATDLESFGRASTGGE